MSRETQFMGHTKEVDAFILECEQIDICGEVTGMFEELVYTLHKYLDTDGGIWEVLTAYENPTKSKEIS